MKAILSKLRGSHHHYSPLQHDIRQKTQQSTLHSRLKTLTILALLTLSFLAGRFSISSFSPLQNPLDFPLHPLTFTHEPLFGSPPSPHSNAAWSSIFPMQGGFFKHPTLAPRRSAFSVFHQLHCLDGIRQGYYALYDVATASSSDGYRSATRAFNVSDMPMMSSPRHVSHCVDLLRQSLMCQPDLTVEIKDEGVGGVLGFGTEHVCEDWDGLLDWVGKWEGYDRVRQQEHGDRNGTMHMKSHG